MDYSPQIDPEFKSLMRKLTKQEARQLRENILSDGLCREPIAIWKGTGLILDGHNSFGICKEFLRDLRKIEHCIKYAAECLPFTNEEANKKAAESLGWLVSKLRDLDAYAGSLAK